jgi:Recombination endonuclease VII
MIRRPRGGKTTHPLYERWAWYHRNESNCDPRWHEFWNFVDDVGEPPNPTDRLYRKDESLPYGPTNFIWCERVLDDVGSQKKAEYAKVWRAAYTVKNPRKFKNQYLRRYGLTIESFEAMLEKQNGVCAICEQKETAVHQTTGEARHLAVDHCHAKLHVRGLLCTQCNRMIGLSRDRPNLLRKAADYLEYHDSLVGRDPPPE